MYKASYLPLALDDLKAIFNYISDTLEAPMAAENLLVKIDKEVLKTEENPFRCHLYISQEKLKYEYRVLHVNNYSLFYTIEKEKIEIHRVIYSRRDKNKISEMLNMINKEEKHNP
jgi:addiction module RelE/StbE family toxin